MYMPNNGQSVGGYTTQGVPSSALLTAGANGANGASVGSPQIVGSPQYMPNNGQSVGGSVAPMMYVQGANVGSAGSPQVVQANYMQNANGLSVGGAQMMQGIQYMQNPVYGQPATNAQATTNTQTLTNTMTSQNISTLSVAQQQQLVTTIINEINTLPESQQMIQQILRTSAAIAAKCNNQTVTDTVEDDQLVLQEMEGYGCQSNEVSFYILLANKLLQMSGSTTVLQIKEKSSAAIVTTSFYGTLLMASAIAFNFL